jgi:hypothetical protein
MRNLLRVLVIPFFINNAMAQHDRNIQKSHQVVLHGTNILAGWSVANIATSGVWLALGSDDAYTKDYHLMNLGWNTVNASIAYWSWISSSKFTSKTTIEQLRYLKRVEQAYLVNVGLDLIYISGGWWMRQQIHHQLDLKAMGDAVILNGAFLMAYDLAMFAWLRNSNSPIYASAVCLPGISKISLSWYF